MRDHDARLGHRDLRNSLSCKVETFSRVAIRGARLRHQDRSDYLGIGMSRDGVMVSHSGHGVWRLTAVMLAPQSEMALTQQGTDPARSNRASQQDRREKYRS